MKSPRDTRWTVSAINRAIDGHQPKATSQLPSANFQLSTVSRQQTSAADFLGPINAWKKNSKMMHARPNKNIESNGIEIHQIYQHQSNALKAQIDHGLSSI